ncbi:hypothetical protein [Mucilaginibacter polytrichastri]|uniref:CD-NTase-associated protein 12/Pycsar effector protein TIR domain-containing protein n=1 Tax=Mucilaginibacter polytrichastri TaxID=1302689 RepID=A0A1Q5ZS21_9SPHI|nr:hypothetical protein [Mucilaginibacter polytrichastri]OKS84572.1 hypothetical protein RG47T_0004 [Mucilaginibacter polytrichastri]SFT02838.1 hypothetical protein SAMN04487890_108230 [Mucilaginibacter polytrichastri]
MERTIFYSWQSDLPSPSNKNLILDALRNSAKNITEDNTVEVEPLVDRDTQGLPGSPDIAAAIFHKIEHSHVFVADISIINTNEGKRKTPNPNVLIELGYELKCLGYERIILIFNTAFGKLDDLPFDLKGKRTMVYHSAEKSENRSVDRKSLEQQLDGAIRTALAAIPAESTVVDSSPAVKLIEDHAPARLTMLKKELKEILVNLDSFAPPTLHKGGNLQLLKDALSHTETAVAHFANLAEVSVEVSDEEAVTTIFNWFGAVVEKFRRPEEYQGITNDGDYDYFRFLGHEMMVTLIAFLLRKKSYPSLKKLLVQPIPINYLAIEYGPAEIYFYNASEWTYLLKEESERLNIATAHGRILNQRHSEGLLAEVMPIKDFAAADFFLFLYFNITAPKTERYNFGWRPWSLPFLEQTPMFLKRAERPDEAQELADFFGLSSVEELRSQLKAETDHARQFFRNITLDLFLRYFRFENIGIK